LDTTRGWGEVLRLHRMLWLKVNCLYPVDGDKLWIDSGYGILSDRAEDLA